MLKIRFNIKGNFEKNIQTIKSYFTLSIYTMRMSLSLLLELNCPIKKPIKNVVILISFRLINRV